MNQAERAVEEFRQQSGLIQGQGAAENARNSELNAQLVVERTKGAEAQARLHQVERLLDYSGGTRAVSKHLQSELIQMREQQAAVDRRAAEPTQEYGEMHPVIVNIHAEAEDLRQKIADEVDRLVQGLRNEVDAARAREGALAAAPSRLREEVGQANHDEVTLRALEREADAAALCSRTFSRVPRRPAARRPSSRPMRQ